MAAVEFAGTKRADEVKQRRTYVINLLRGQRMAKQRIDRHGLRTPKAAALAAVPFAGASSPEPAA
jgi:hypothetical protein